MIDSTPENGPPEFHTSLSKPRELTWQAVVSAFVVAAVVSASYPYIVLKLGLGPNVSVVSAFLGALLLLVLARQTHGRNRLMNNIVQTAGTSAASTAFLCVVAAAVGFADENPVVQGQLNGIHGIAPWPMFWWLSCAGGIGVLFAVLFRRHFLEDPKMIFADGVAAAETIVVLDTREREAAGKLATLGVCAAASALVDWFREGVEVLHNFFFGSRLLASYKAGIEWNMLTVGTGLLIGLNVSLSMLAATVVIVLAGPRLIDSGIARDIVVSNVADDNVPRIDRVTGYLGLLGTPAPLQAATLVGATEGVAPAGATVNRRAETARILDRPRGSLTPQERFFAAVYGGRRMNYPVLYLTDNDFNILLLWFMWPATGLMITSAITAVLLKWRSIVEGLRQFGRGHGGVGRQDVSLGTIVVGSILLTVVLAVVQHANFGMSYVQTVVAVLCTLPLILVCIRVQGETNFAPISVMMNGLQAVFALFWSGSVGHNLIASGVAGTSNSQGTGTIQDYKTGQLVGSTPRVLTWVQLAAVPIGAAAVAVMYPLLTDRYVLGDTLPAPTGIKIANMAVLLAQGVDAFPRGALLWTVIASVAGILLALARDVWRLDWLPSAGGFGLGLILPGLLTIPIAVGGVLGWVWERTSKPSYDRYVVTVASGLIAGEALLGGLVLPVLAWFAKG